MSNDKPCPKCREAMKALARAFLCFGGLETVAKEGLSFLLTKESDADKSFAQGMDNLREAAKALGMDPCFWDEKTS